ncbi:signal peptidase I [Tenericutes bacterium MO-XQ]|nr:signal peptidase I [Tenericutes bacterium MO-XQ]
MKNKKTTQTIKTVLFYLITLFLLAYVSVSLFLPEKVIDVFGFQLTTISRATESMVPTIEPGDIIMLKDVDEEDIEENDIISFYNYARGQNSQGQEVWIKIRIVHRLIEIDDETGAYITQGDNNNSIDTIYDENGNITELTYDQVIGEYVFRVPIIGTIVSGLRNPVLVGLLIVNITIIVVIVKLVKKKDEPKNEGEHNDLG